MADILEVTVAGNLRQDVQIITRGGEEIAMAQVCTTQRHIRKGIPTETSVCLTIEVRGMGEAHAFAAVNRQGSRVVLRGRLEQRQRSTTQQLERADGLGLVMVAVEQSSWVVVVEAILADGATLGKQRLMDSTHHQRARVAAPVPRQEAARPSREIAAAPSEQPTRRSWQWPPTRNEEPS